LLYTFHPDNAQPVGNIFDKWLFGNCMHLQRNPIIGSQLGLVAITHIGGIYFTHHGEPAMLSSHHAFMRGMMRTQKFQSLYGFESMSAG
jgi:hypothetical protein